MPKHIARLIIPTLLLLSIAGQAPSAEPETVTPIRALLITGGCCHDYTAQKNILSDGISARANVAFTVVQQGGETTDAKIPLYENANWAKGFDVIIHDECFAGVADPAWTERILKPHREGTPAVVLHCAMHCYRDKTDEWFKFCGVTSHRHGAHYPFVVENVDKAHPIMKGFGDRWETPKEELYQIAKVWPTATPLGKARSRETKNDEVVIWTNQFGKGRVFGTTIGHYNETVSQPAYLNLVTRGLLWSVGKLDEEHLRPLSAPPSPSPSVDMSAASDGWKTISNGKDFDGWKPNETPESWKIEDGAFVAHGQRSHLFYIGEKEPFKNFEFQCEVKTTPGSNGGLCFHTGWAGGWPTVRQGMESQVANTHSDQQKTGGLYNIVKVNPSPVKDSEWWTHYIKVDGKRVVVKVNDKVVVDYTEPADAKGPNKISAGSFCLQAHDPKSTVYYRNIKVKRLP